MGAFIITFRVLVLALSSDESVEKAGVEVLHDFPEHRADGPQRAMRRRDE